MSSDAASVVAVADLTLTSSPTDGVSIDREVTDGFLYSYNFYLHVKTTGGSYAASKVTSPLSLTPFAFC